MQKGLLRARSASFELALTWSSVLNRPGCWNERRRFRLALDTILILLSLRLIYGGVSELMRST